MCSFHDGWQCGHILKWQVWWNTGISNRRYRHKNCKLKNLKEVTSCLLCWLTIYKAPGRYRTPYDQIFNIYMKRCNITENASTLLKTMQHGENAPTCIRQYHLARQQNAGWCVVVVHFHRNWRGEPMVKGKLLVMLSIQGQHGICV